MILMIYFIPSIGLSKILGEKAGERVDVSELEEVMEFVVLIAILLQFHFKISYLV